MCACYEGFQLQPDGRTCLGELIVGLLFKSYFFDKILNMNFVRGILRGLLQIQNDGLLE